VGKIGFKGGRVVSGRVVAGRVEVGRIMAGRVEVGRIVWVGTTVGGGGCEGSAVELFKVEGSEISINGRAAEAES